MKFKIGMCFSRPFEGNRPLDHIGKKLPVYLRFLELCREEGWQVFVLTRRTYEEKGVFNGVWQFAGREKFLPLKEKINVDLVYDRTGGIDFPPEEEEIIFVNRRDFKILCYDKWRHYQVMSKFMPQTFWVGKKENLPMILPKIKGEWLVLKPYNALKGIGIFVGPKSEALNFEFSDKYPLYLAQEFVDTGGGIPGIIEEIHDLRVAIVNGKPVWCHVRTPPPGKLTANVAQGGTITEVDYESQVPVSIKKIVAWVAPQFSKRYDEPIYSLDFGIGPEGPKIFEINDQIGFPAWEMKNRDRFLLVLVNNFKRKLQKFVLDKRVNLR